MAPAASRSSRNTKLIVAGMEAPVGLFGTEAKPGKTQEFETAGPNGGVLQYEQRGVAKPEPTEAPADEPVGPSDPLAGDPGPEAPPVEPTATQQQAAALIAGGNGMSSGPASTLVEGEFRQVLVEAGSGEVVEPENVRRGVRLEDGRFVDCTAQLAAIVERTKLDRIEVVKCIDGTRIHRTRVTGAYYIGGTEPEALPVLRLLYEGLKRRREAAVVKYTTGSRQNLGVLVADGVTQTLVLLDLIFSEDVREAPAKARAIQKVGGITEEHVEKMSAILGAMHGTPDVLDELRDDAIALREELRARALAGEMDAEVVEPVVVPEPVADIGDALEASLAAVRAGKV